MTLFRLIIKSILHYRKQHIALMAGTLLSTAILTGALITGDSVDYSLRKMVELRLGNTGFALQTGDRFVRSQLATEMAKKIETKTAAVLTNQGVTVNPENGLRVNRTEILGIDEEFIALSQLKFDEPKNGEAIISENIAQKLQLAVGDDVIVRMENASIIPVNAPFAEDNTASKSLRLKVVRVAGENQLGRFSLQSNQVAPFNIFIAREQLGEALGLEGLSNLILVENNANLSTEKINQILSESWNLKDAGLHIKELPDSETYELSSNRIFIDPNIANAIEGLKIPQEPILTYLVNNIRFRNKTTPYSFVTASLSPLIPQGLKSNEIIINSWLAEDLDARPGDTISLTYFIIGPLRKLEETRQNFVVKTIIQLDKSASMQALMPDFPGMANAGSCSEWETGVPINLEAIRDKDEDYWDRYRGTPKGFISIETGEKIWGNSFGNLTAFRFPTHEISLPALESKILGMLTPADIGLQFRPVKNEGVKAVDNAVDFGELFLSLSFFVIAAGVLLTALLFSLHVSARSKESGTLSALGFSRRQIVRFRILEALLVIVLGALAGTFVGILYNQAIMSGLNTVWQDVVRTTMLWVDVRPGTLLTGAISGALIAFATIWMVTRQKMKRPIHYLISQPIGISSPKQKRKNRGNILLILLGFLSSIALVSYSLLTRVDQNSSLFLAAGGLFLTASLAVVFRMLANIGCKQFTAPMPLWQLSLKNAGRNKTGSLTTIALLALGTFTIIITGANQQTFFGVSGNKASGTGGFLFWAETSIPLIYDLNSPEGKTKYGLEDEPILNDVEFIQFQSRHGDDASCLNLNQVSQPQILGINPKIFDQKEAFSFANLLDKSNAGHPWLALETTQDDHLIPAIADQTVITWGLMKKVGDTLTYLNEQGNEIKLLLVAGLKNSIFQGNILIDEKQFLKNFPSSGGSQVMLIDAPLEKQDRVANLLEERLTDFGIQLTPTVSRLAAFNSVTNTYLSVFMILGGLGVLIGTIGLGIVLLRNMLERKNELTLLSAVGFRKKQILKLIFLENLLLLGLGLILGILSAIIGILPTLLSPAFTMNTPLILILVLIVFISGIIWIYFPARQSLGKLSIRELQAE